MRSLTTVLPGVHRLEKVLPWGWSLSMLVFELPAGGLLVHSPTWCGDGTFDALDTLGEVKVLLAPNHYHHVSLARFRERYPAAIAVASAGARPRLEKKRHVGLTEVAELEAQLPAGAAVIACEAVNNGELWLRWPTPDGPALVVCDGFFHVTRPTTGVPGWMLRRMHTAPGLCFGWTFKALVVTDRAGFRDWAIGAIEELAPVHLLPSHGELLSDPDGLAGRLTALLRTRLGWPGTEPRSAPRPGPGARG